MKYNKQTITLTTDSIKDMDFTRQSQVYFNEEKTKILAESLAILLGEYNKYGKKIPLDEFNKIKKSFDDVVNDMKKIYSKYN